MVFAFRATHINLISLKQGWIFKHKLKVEDPEHDPIFLFWLRLHLPKEYKIHSQSIWVFTHCKSHENLRVSQKLAHCGSSSWSSVHRYSLWFTYYLRLKDPLKKADPALIPTQSFPVATSWVSGSTFQCSNTQAGEGTMGKPFWNCRHLGSGPKGEWRLEVGTSFDTHPNSRPLGEVWPKAETPLIQIWA